MANNYSRLKKTESRRAYRSIIFYSLLTMVIMFAMLRFGTVYLFKFTNYLGTMAGRENTVIEKSSTKPLPPVLSDVPLYTNEESITLSGRAQPGIDVTVVVNEDQRQILADAQGEFNAKVELSKSKENKIYAYSTDNAGLESNHSKTHTVIFDNQPPVLEIISPQSGSKYYLESERNVKIEGQTEDKATVRINDRVVIINNEDKFAHPVRLENGQNTFTIIAIDQAGNEAQIEDYTLELSL